MLDAHPDKNPPRLLTMEQVVERCAFGGRFAIYELLRSNRFPKPIRLSDRRVAFVESEVSEWIAQRIAQSRAKPNGWRNGTTDKTTSAAGKASARKRHGDKAPQIKRPRGRPRKQPPS